MKHKLRKEISKSKAIYSEEQLKQFSEDIFKTLEQTQVFSEAKYILAYYSLPGEVFTHDFIEKHTHNKIIVLPVVKNDVLVLKEFNGVGKMKNQHLVFLNQSEKNLLIILKLI